MIILRKLFLFAAAFVFSAGHALAETPADKAFMIKFVELSKGSSSMSAKGDDEGLEKLVPPLKSLLTTPNISKPCLEAVQAKVETIELNVKFLRAEEGKEQPFFLDLVKKDRIFTERRLVCLDGRVNP